jgi:hypothetical protein
MANQPNVDRVQAAANAQVAPDTTVSAPPIAQVLSPGRDCAPFPRPRSRGRALRSDMPGIRSPVGSDYRCPSKPGSRTIGGMSMGTSATGPAAGGGPDETVADARGLSRPNRQRLLAQAEQLSPLTNHISFTDTSRVGPMTDTRAAVLHADCNRSIPAAPLPRRSNLTRTCRRPPGACPGLARPPTPVTTRPEVRDVFTRAPVPPG